MEKTNHMNRAKKSFVSYLLSFRSYLSSSISYLLSFIFYLLSFSSFAAFNYRDRVDAQFAGKDVTMRFEFYATTNESDAALFVTNQLVHVSSNGVFCAEVGVPADKSVAVFSTTNDRYLAVWAPNAVGGEPSVRLHDCRRKLMPVPTAIFAQDAQTAPNGFIVRGKSTLYNGIEFRDGSDSYYTVDEEGHMSVPDLVTEALSADNGTFGGSLSVGNDLTMTKGFAIDDAKGRQVVGSNATLVARNVNVKTLTMPGMSDSLVPVGLIMLWWGDANKVPEGWAICDGSKGTPDLTGRFVVGATQQADQWNTYLNKGGKRAVALSSEQIPKHGHDYFGDDQLVTHAEKSRDHSGYDADSEKKGDSAWFRTGESGGGKEHENRPPFKALYYIMRVK